MNFLRNLFGGGSQGGNQEDKVGIYFYIQPNGCQEVVRVRIDRNNDPSLDEDGTYFVHKTVRGTTYKCTRSAELELRFDTSRRLQQTTVSGGKEVTKADYEAWLATQQPTAE
jgi:hypothetical protein